MAEFCNTKNSILSSATLTPLIHIEIIYIENANIKNNLHAPTGERTTKNESSSDALGIPDLRPPAAMDFHNKKPKSKALKASHSTSNNV